MNINIHQDQASIIITIIILHQSSINIINHHQDVKFECMLFHSGVERFYYPHTVRDLRLGGK